MPKDLYQFDCPCCGKRVEVNTRSGRARAVRPEERAGGGDLDALLDKHKRESDRLDDMFRDASEGARRAGKEQHERFDRAREQVEKEEPQDKPPHPFQKE